MPITYSRETQLGTRTASNLEQEANKYKKKQKCLILIMTKYIEIGFICQEKCYILREKNKIHITLVVILFVRSKALFLAVSFSHIKKIALIGPVDIIRECICLIIYLYRSDRPGPFFEFQPWF